MIKSRHLGPPRRPLLALRLVGPIQPGDGGCRSEPNVLFVRPAARRRHPRHIRRLVIPQHDGPVDRHDAVVLPFLANQCHPLLIR
jgi:hypothetical protein